MSMGSVSNAKAELIDAGLISIAKKPSGRGEDYDEIHILDITERNVKHCATRFTSSPHELTEVHSSPHERISSPDELTVHHMNVKVHQVNTLQEQYKKEGQKLSKEVGEGAPKPAIDHDAADAPRPQNTPTATDTPPSSDAVTQSPAPNIAPKLDPIQHMIERQAQARTPAKIINQWQGAEYLKALCIAFADVMNVEVTKADRAKWMGGAARLYELHPTQTELVQARDHAARCDYALTHPAAACETIKAIRQKARPQALAHPQPSVHQVVSYTVKEQVYDD